MEELAERLRRSTVQIVLRNGAHERIATLQDIQEYLGQFGLEITTSDAVDWGTNYPHAAADIALICDLQQRLDTLTQATGENPHDGLPLRRPQTPHP